MALGITTRQIWMIIHLGLGAIFLHAFAGGLAGIGLGEKARRLTSGTWVMAVTAWLTVISGTWIVYPWYRANPPRGSSNLESFPRSWLNAGADVSGWHHFGMEWKEHVGWVAPFLATAVAYIVIRYGPQLAKEARMRKALMVLFSLSFATAATAGALGAFINKVSPNTFLR